MRVLSAAHDLTVVGSSGTRNAPAMCAEQTPDIALLNMFMPDPDHIKVAQAILSGNGLTRVVGLAEFDEREYAYAHTMLRIGVSGYLLSAVDLADLAVSLRAVHSGQVVCSRAIARALIGAPRKF
jgi:DNA-binding NarL/FixJ family response regulator